MPAKIDLTGKVFHRLTVKKEAGRDRHGLAMWECECSCGAGNEENGKTEARRKNGREERE